MESYHEYTEREDAEERRELAAILKDRVMPIDGSRPECAAEGCTREVARSGSQCLLCVMKRQREVTADARARCSNEREVVGFLARRIVKLERELERETTYAQKVSQK